MDFDEKLDELKHHVDEVQASVQAAATENRASVKQRIDRAQRDIDEASNQARQDVMKASDATQAKWAQFKADASAKLASTKAKAEHRADALDARIASTEADAAKADAYSAIDFADWAVENARLAMLDAIDARVYADSLAVAAKA